MKQGNKGKIDCKCVKNEKVIQKRSNKLNLFGRIKGGSFVGRLVLC